MSDANLTDVMIDIETMGINRDAAVIQIGALVFDWQTGMMPPDIFREDVDLMSSIMAGGETDRLTTAWWRQQEGLDQIDPKQIGVVLHALNKWLAQYPTIERVWAKGPTFDLTVLEGYYDRLGIKRPWRYNQPRDTRTVIELARTIGNWIEPTGVDPKHDAAEDCRRQCVQLVSALKYIKISG